MADVFDRGPLYSATVASTDEITTNDFYCSDCNGVTLYVYSARGGTLDVDVYINGTAREISSDTIAAADATAIVYQFRIPRGRCRFTPADSTSGTTSIDFTVERGSRG